MSDHDEQLNKIEKLVREMGYSDTNVAEMRDHLQPPKKKPSQAERKAQILTVIQEFLAEEVTPRYVREETVHDKYPYPIHIRAEWRKNTIFFVKQLMNPQTQEPFEYDYAKMSLKAGSHFNVAYHRHTGRYVILYYDISLNECLEVLRTDMLLQP